MSKLYKLAPKLASYGIGRWSGGSGEQDERKKNGEGG